MTKPPKPPADLPVRHRELWLGLVDEYGIRDKGGLEVLSSGLRSLGLAEQAEQAIAADGLLVTDRFGQRKAHPLCAVARDHRAAWQAALRNLNLPIGEVPTVGRPGGL